MFQNNMIRRSRCSAQILRSYLFSLCRRK